MRAIGFRAEKDAIHWGFVVGTHEAPRVAAHGCLHSPEGHTATESLCWFRAELQTMLQRRRPGQIAVQLVTDGLLGRPTPKAVDAVLRRARIEGVILEVCGPGVVCLDVLYDDATNTPRRTKPRRSSYLAADRFPLEWKAIPSRSRREAIKAAAILLDSKPAMVMDS